MTKADYLAYVNGYNTEAGFPNRAAATYDLYFGGVTGVNEGIPWSEIVGFDYLDGEQHRHCLRRDHRRRKGR